MKISGTQGTGRYLIDVEQPRGDLAVGRILDLDRGAFYPPILVESILARGYWEPYDGPQGILPGLLKRVVNVERPVAPREKS